MNSKFKAGERVMAREYTTGKWRPATVTQPAPYPRGNCDGAYIQWTDLPQPCPSHVSTTAWMSENCLQPLTP